MSPAMSKLTRLSVAAGALLGAAFLVPASPVLATGDGDHDPEPECHEAYEPCVPVDEDVDCEGGEGDGPSYVEGPIIVLETGVDPYGLDHDGDGIGCAPSPEDPAPTTSSTTSTTVTTPEPSPAPPTATPAPAVVRTPTYTG